MVYITDPVIYILENGIYIYIWPTQLYILENGIYNRPGYWLYILENGIYNRPGYSRCILCSECAPSFCLDSLQSQLRNTVFFGKTYRLAPSSFRSFRHFITDIACHLNNYVIYLSVRHWTLVDSNVYHNTTKVWYVYFSQNIRICKITFNYNNHLQSS